MWEPPVAGGDLGGRLGVLEAGAAHPQRREQLALAELAERPPGARGDELAEDEIAEMAPGPYQDLLQHVHRPEHPVAVHVQLPR